ncbi:putative E3 ubiquitin ligase SUD1 [Cardamine amara subsp. amara]|uniref:E3 ubiquitin ligase SUD1 n=1 Tax=Cardamine amara subsp. amara TaxID=228776 RepID=A0ABD1AUS4_CARAN
MSNHMVVYIDGLMRPVSLPPVLAEVENMRSESSTAAEDNVIDIYDGDTTEEELIWSAECRICQEECAIKNLESPCACNGSLKYAHRKCVQRWCNEKGNTICEICHQPYQAGYTSPPPPPPSEETTIDIGGGWTISGLDLHDPRLLAIAEAERQILESEYDDYTASDTSGAAFFRSAALILMTLLLLRHALTIPDYIDGEDDPSSILSLFLLRAASFLLPCYIMASAISILHRRRQRQEAAALATRFALVLSSRQPRAVVNYLSMEP